MDPKLLVAVDDSQNARRCVDFIVKNFKRSTRIVLFSVLPDPMIVFDMNSPELTAYFNTQQEWIQTLQSEKAKLMQSLLEQARLKLMEAGFPKEKIMVRLEEKKVGIAQDIVEAARDGYDMIIMGRRGLSGLKEFFLGSISQKVLHLAKDISILIVN